MTLAHSQPDLLALDAPTSPLRAAPLTAFARSASHRDPTVDAVRAGALLIVVVLHALMVGAQIAPTGALRTSVALSGETWFVPMTWVLQIMPLFFIAGGFASLSQWRRMRDRGASAAEYVTARTRRLAVPAILMIGSVGGALLLARALGADAALIDEASLRIGQPLWFLATYFGVTALVPAMAWLHDRIPLITVFALACGVFIVDVAHARLGAPVGYLNLVLVWPLMQQLGFLMRDGLSFAVWRRRGLVIGLLASLALLLALIGRGWSPDMLVNLNPSTTAIMLLGTAQFFLLQLLRPLLVSLTRGPRSTHLISRANAAAMGAYLWHMPVILALVALMWSAGLPMPDPHSGAWWATRPLWLLVIGCCVIPLAALIAPLERRILARLQATATATGFRSRAGTRGLWRMRGVRGWSALLSVLCGIGGTASALLAGIASPLPYAAALALLALGLHFATLHPRPAPLRFEDHLARRGSTLERPMRFGRLGQRKAGADAEVELAGLHRCEELAIAPRPLFGGAHEVPHRGSGDRQGSPRVEALQVEGRHRPARRAEEHEFAAHAQRRQRIVERTRPDSVVDHRDALAIGELSRPCREVVVVKDLCGTRTETQLALLGSRHCCEHPHPARDQQLGEQQPDSTGSCVHDHRLPCPGLRGRGGEIVRGDPLQRNGGGDVGRDALGHAHRSIGRNDEALGVGARGLCCGDHVTGCVPLDAVPDLEHHACSFSSGSEGVLHGVDARSLIGLDEVHADSAGLHEQLSRAGRGALDLGELQQLWAPGLGNGDRTHLRHDFSLR